MANLFTLSLEETPGSDEALHVAATIGEQKRPDEQEMVEMRQFWKNTQEALERNLARKPVAWLGVFVDEKGPWMIVALKAPNQLSNAKRSIRNLLKDSMKGAEEFSKTFGQLDSLHAERIRGFKTIEDVKPIARPRDFSAKGLSEWMQAGGDFDSIPKKHEIGMDGPILDWDAAEASIATPFNLLKDQAAPQAITDPEGSSDEEWNKDLAIKGTSLPEQWKQNVHTKATVLIFDLGIRPETLFFRKLHLRHRRLQACAALMRQMADSPNLSHAYAAARIMIEAGDFPDMINSKPRRLKDLHNFCEEVTQELGGQVDGMSAVDKMRINKAIGEAIQKDILEDGCLWVVPQPCKGKASPNWHTLAGGAWSMSDDFQKAFCGHCGMPAIFGRTEFTFDRAILQSTLGFVPSEDVGPRIHQRNTWFPRERIEQMHAKRAKEEEHASADPMLVD